MLHPISWVAVAIRLRAADSFSIKISKGSLDSARSSLAGIRVTVDLASLPLPAAIAVVALEAEAARMMSRPRRGTSP